ncbi:hypothetical protein KC865_05115, partial [Candidatus Kaiserbacteria bacterium]|nr:hypothetical protein [Candidatus Kaiserbacteria bacterium]
MITGHKQWALFLTVLFCALICSLFLLPQYTKALNISEYKDRLSDSGPGEYSNHTIEFLLNTNVSPGGVIEITPPGGFDIIASSTFAERNVELYVNGTPRISSTAPSPGVDMVEITTGSPGLIRYTLAPDSGITSGSRLQFRIGNHTSTALIPVTSFSTSTGTTTTQGDVEPIQNSMTLGVHEVNVEIYDGGLVANEEFIIFLNEKVTVPNIDTTETVPPFRFNGAPTSTVGGTTLNVEISLETDELAICKFSSVPDVSFSSMPNVFSNTGFIFHSNVVPVVKNALNTYYVRCIDDENNFNIDDYVISFFVNDEPTGTSNTEGDVEGDGTGSGNDGTGSGSGGGGQSGAASG